MAVVAISKSWTITILSGSEDVTSASLKTSAVEKFSVAPEAVVETSKGVIINLAKLSRQEQIEEAFADLNGKIDICVTEALNATDKKRASDVIKNHWKKEQN